MNWRLLHIPTCLLLMAFLSSCTGIRLSSVLNEIEQYSERQKNSRVVISGKGQHVVQSGETVYRISSAYGVSMRQVIQRNSLRPPYTLHVGQVLWIPMSKTHTVHRGDTVYRVSKKYGVDSKVLIRTNNLRYPYTIHIGQVLRLPAATQTVLARNIKKYPKKKTIFKSSTAATKKKVVSKTSHKTNRYPSTVKRKPNTKVATKSAPRSVNIPRPPPRQGKGLAWPVRGKIIVPFGSVAKGMRNDGINIAAKLGTSIRAAEAGVVAYAGNELKGFGNMLLLKHDKGLITTYAHAHKIKVKRGATVKRGQIIASVGQTGSVTKPQLHFEVRQGSKALDPRKHLR